MKREQSTPRPNWQRRCEEIDFDWHSLGGRYWDESTRYRFTLDEVEQIEKATEELHAMCMQLVTDVISKGDYRFLGIPEKTLRHVVPAVEASWNRRDPTFYGRFDFGVVVNPDGSLGVKMYEYNADTPTSLYEASVVQWRWLKDMGLPDQFNSIEEKMDKFFRTKVHGTHTHFLTMQDCGPEDAGTVGYIAERARAAGKNISALHIEQLGVGNDKTGEHFIDLSNKEIMTAFKLYAWEWMLADKFGEAIPRAPTTWLEPPWKLLLTTKAILPLLWEKYPNHPNLLPAFFAKDGKQQMMRGEWIKKPLFSREGSNVSLIKDGKETRLSGLQHNEFLDGYGYVGQKSLDATRFDGQIPVIGSWVIDGLPAGIGIREDSGVTGNTSRFVPHYFVD